MSEALIPITVSSAPVRSAPVPSADHLSRRTALLAAGSGAAVLAVAACGQGSSETETAAGGENILGDPNAPVTIIEYASTTCPVCKAFHDEVFPELKARYIDAGKVCFVFRELPTSPAPLAMAGFLTARCAPGDKYFDVLDVLFDRQPALVQAFQSGGPGARTELVRIAGTMGITEEEFDVCISDTDEIERIRQVGEDGRQDHNVTGTPTFVINGETYGPMPIEQLAAILDPLLSEG